MKLLMILGLTIFAIALFAANGSIVKGNPVTIKSLTNVQDSVKKSNNPVTIPEGTRLMVKLDKPISTAQHKKGAVITAVLDIDLAVDGKVIAPKGSQVYGKVIESRGGKVLGGQKLVVQFTDLMINNQLTPMLTDPVGVEGGKGKTIKKVGAGALIGSAFGGSKGAKEGALIAGGLSILGASANHIQIPAGTIAEIPLQAPVVIK